ncbi:EamA-like transporter family [Methanocella conradii HZ254]|uniref:EamA-like transporter family n=2 Tax=Methanocella TaxID=570266 RepID=H8I8B0_METCZ|nr:EamA-like transporter family [Methanocella conradii HZ254]
MHMNVVVELAISSLLAAAGQVAWRLGMKSAGTFDSYDLNTLLHVFTNWQVDLGLVLYGLSTLFWLSALSKKDLSYVYPFVAGTYILVLLLSYFVLKENFGLDRVFGAALVLTGLIIIVRGG